MIMLFNLLLDMPHMSDGWITNLVAKSEINDIFCTVHITKQAENCLLI
jgi:hypothetical protein